MVGLNLAPLLPPAGRLSSRQYLSGDKPALRDQLYQQQLKAALPELTTNVGLYLLMMTGQQNNEHCLGQQNNEYYLLFLCLGTSTWGTEMFSLFSFYVAGARDSRLDGSLRPKSEGNDTSKSQMRLEIGPEEVIII